MEDFGTKTVVVTGGGTGIGFAVVKRFYRGGANVVICGRRRAILEQAREKLGAAGDRFLAVPADISAEGEVADLMQAAVSWKGRIDVLVHCAAAMRVNKAPQETSLADWKSVVDTNVTGSFLCCREAGKVMIGQGGGKIINISSMSGFIVNRYFHGGSYEVSKAAMTMLTKVLAVEWAPYNVTVNAVAPGYYDTEPNRDFFSREPQLAQQVADLIPMGRLGNLDQLSELIGMLASEAFNYMSGATIVIDGGYTLW